MESTLDALIETIRAHKHGNPETSYVAKRFAKGRAKIAQKIGEEGVELALAVVLQNKQEIICETADLLFHILIALEEADLSFGDVMAELQQRQGVSGIAAKKARYAPIVKPLSD
ncbi:MAG: phosphoribosyl-ATP diphosphatase [Alphaproteobacteria bacterium]|nr:MAG: phosphoribosyl-ATP diphosphatase [Alphaproteobacteria bacterium]